MVPGRLIPVATAAVLGLVALTGCRVEAGAAAYVGGERITDARVDTIVKEVQSYIPEGGTGSIRQEVLSWMVMTVAGRRYADAKHVTVKPVDPVADAEANRLPPGAVHSDFAKVKAEYDAVASALASLATTTAPSEADQREVYDNAPADAHTQPFDQVKQFFTEQTIGRAVGFRNVLRDVVKASDISISPRYGPLRLPVPVTVEQVPTYLLVPLEANPASPAVVDAR